MGGDQPQGICRTRRLASGLVGRVRVVLEQLPDRRPCDTWTLGPRTVTCGQYGQPDVPRWYVTRAGYPTNLTRAVGSEREAYETAGDWMGRYAPWPQWQKTQP